MSVRYEVRRIETTPCPYQASHTIGAILGQVGCERCGGSGVVEAVTMHGLEVTFRTEYAHDGAERTPTYLLAALNTEGPTP